MLDAINRAALRRHWLIVLIVSSATHLAHQATSALAKLGGARNTLQRILITVAQFARVVLNVSSRARLADLAVRALNELARARNTLRSTRFTVARIARPALL